MYQGMCCQGNVASRRDQGWIHCCCVVVVQLPMSAVLVAGHGELKRDAKILDKDMLHPTPSVCHVPILPI